MASQRDFFEIGSNSIFMFRNFFENSTYLLFAAAFVLLTAYAVFIQPPADYPTGGTISAPEGARVDEVAHSLSEIGAIRSPELFSLLVRLMSPEHGVIASTYALPTSENVFSLAQRFVDGTTGIEAIRVTIPEGLNSGQIGDLLSERIEDFDSEEFTLLAKPEEGYLFPDTYYFLPDTSPRTAVDVMRNNFNSVVGEIEEEIRASGLSIHEIVTMASLLEEEARRPETRKIVAGILWKRIEIGMPLQVDAVFGYILGKNGYAPNFDDLEVESPYNTYLNRGLPPGPISNPGLVSIEAALYPTETDYLYYLTGADGLMYYAKTFEQHKANRSKLR
jgi:UPF0755 protein